MMVSSNIRRIIAFFELEAPAADAGVRKRVRRRKDEHGYSLEELHEEWWALSPPA